MNVKLLIILLSCLSLLHTSGIHGQDNEGQKEIIIIEKIVDEKGNVISKNTKRYSGNYSEESIQELLEAEDYPSIRSYDLEGLGLEDSLDDIFSNKNQRPTIGVNLALSEGKTIVDRVFPGSGAADADLRSGDEIISINGIAISSVEDIHDILDSRKSGDQIKLLIVRDGQEYDKTVVLGNKAGAQSLFNFPEGGTFRLFGESGDFPFDIDSLLRDFSDRGNFWDQFGFVDPPNSTRKEVLTEEGPPSLGIFLNDSPTEVIVESVIEDSPAAKGGLQEGDVILRLDDNLVSSFREVKSIMNTKRNGDQLQIEILRRGEQKSLLIQL